MGRGRWAFWGLVLCLSIITLNYEKSPIFERSTQSSIILFFFCGIFVLLYFNSKPWHILPTTLTAGHSPFSFRNRLLFASSRELPLSPLDTNIVLNAHKNFFLICFAAGAMCLRVEIFRWILGNRQCSLSDVEGLVPLLVAIYESWYLQSRYSATAQNSSSTGSKKVTYGKPRYVLAAAVLSIASILTSFGSDDVRSSYICPHFARKFVPLLQISGALLDSIVLISIDIVVRRTTANDATVDTMLPRVVGSVLALSTAFLSLGGFIAFVTHPGQWKWVLGIDRSYVSSLTWYTALFTVMILCCIEICQGFGLLLPVAFVTFICAYASGFQNALRNQAAYIYNTQSSSILSIIFLFLGAGLFLHVASSDSGIAFKPTHRLIPHVPLSAYTLLAGLLLVRSFVQFRKTINITDHPIDNLIFDAKAQSEAWFAQATTSTTLQEAVATYRRRYHRHPPPGFDAWYFFAVNKSSAIIDDFDSIMRDLHPFWARKPFEIRRATRVILEDEWNDVAEISIRSGKAEVGPNVVPTHRWMVDGVLVMLEEFVPKLPDMDLAFNINDEPRTAVPWETLQKLLEAGSPQDSLPQNLSNAWSLDRAKTWQLADGVKESERPFQDHSLINSFPAFGSVACPPNSLARTSHLWDPHKLCMSCAAPHSLGSFLQNWALSASPCHQPDLAHLHGFYLSPAAYKPSHDLLPVFSQSKSHGHADILYPSAWNYMDKVKYEPSDAFPDAPFESKRNGLFWRGATSEGLSKDATWKGMARQRFVHLTNNATERFSVLVPHPTQPGAFTYELLPASSLPSLGLDMDTAIVDEIVRCWDADCTHQEAEFGLAGKSDFQAHWGYRFLMDLDGAGFSGRFLPFLRSRSVVFKTAVFREWWDDRLTAWRHFVPVDIRFHGLLSTLAYFAGTDGNGNGSGDKGGGSGHGDDGKSKKFPAMEAHVEAGARIAEDSRIWADRVLRKEDMQVYMFRLLLEWGRLTDDRRDEIGFEG